MNNTFFIRMGCMTALLLITISLVNAQNNSQSEIKGDYEYMTIIAKQFDSKLSAVYISTSSGAYEEIKFDPLKEKLRFSFKDILEIISKYQLEGWETISSNMLQVGEASKENFYTYYFLKRKKKS